MLSKLRHIWQAKDVRNSLLFVLAIIVVFRIAAHIPVPGVEASKLAAFFGSNQLFGLLNLFSGGGMNTFSIVALGVGPYITASIIIQLFGMIIPSIEELQKEGTYGQEKINRWTRYLTVPLAALQAYSMIALLRQSGSGIIGDITAFQQIAIVLSMTAGTMFLMWLGELISEKKVGNGISLMIFAGIIAGLPAALQQALVTYDQGQLITYLALAAIGLVTIAGVVFVSEAQRNLPVIYAKRMAGGRQTGGAETKLPLRVNMAGVIPIIFAVSLILFPPMVAQFFVAANTAAVASAAKAIITFFQDPAVYAILYAVLVFAFTYFYTSIIFKPEQVAENIQKQGGFIPGVRPGRPTAEYLTWVLNRITPAGAIFLTVLAVMPVILQRVTGNSSVIIGGTGLLIVVSVVIEMVNQIDAKLTTREYDKV